MSAHNAETAMKTGNATYLLCDLKTLSERRFQHDTGPSTGVGRPCGRSPLAAGRTRPREASWSDSVSGPLVFLSPDPLDELMRREAAECLESALKIMRADEARELVLKVLMVVAPTSLDRRFIKNAVLPFGGFSRPVVDSVLSALCCEGIGKQTIGRAGRGSGQSATPEGGIRVHHLDPEGDDGNQQVEEIQSRFFVAVSEKAGEDELAGTIDGHEKIKNALLCPHFGDAEVELAKRAFSSF